MKIILTIVFICWGIYAVKIAIDTNKKAYDIKKGISQKEYDKYKKKLIRKHISKIFIGLFVVLIIILILVFVESRID